MNNDVHQCERTECHEGRLRLLASPGHMTHPELILQANERWIGHSLLAGHS